MADSNKRLPNRRRFLQLTGGTALATTLAGCSSNGGSGSDGGDGGGMDGGGSDGGSDGGSGSGDGSDGGSSFPSKNLTWIVPYSTGGGFDTYSRGMAEYMPKHLPTDVNIVVQNISGAGGRQGATKIYRADPDGYTFGIFNIPGMVASQIVMETEYDLANVSWIGRIARSVYMLAVPADSPYETVEDLQNADEIKFAVTGPGSTSYLSAIIAANAMDIPATFVTGYSGSQESVAAALRGDVDAVQYPTSTPSIRNPIEDGDMRAIVYYAEDPPEWSGAISTQEAGYPDLAGQVNLQRCVGGPPEIPDGPLNTLRSAFEDTVTSDEFSQWAEDQGRPLDYASGAETGEIISNAQSTFEDYRDLLEEKLK